MNQDEFNAFVRESARRNRQEEELYQAAKHWHDTSRRFDYPYMFSWLGVPIIQDPQDICVLHELIWQVKPDVVIETGIARGGSLMLSASVLALLDYTDALAAGTSAAPTRKVIAVDIDIRAHTQILLETTPLKPYLHAIQGSSVDETVAQAVKAQVPADACVLVLLDSNHTHEHVLLELQHYAPLVSMDSYCVVLDTGVEEVPPDDIHGRPWGKGNSPKTAVDTYLEMLEKHAIAGMDGQPLAFVRDYDWVDRSIISCAREGFLRRVQKD
ncbi:MAG: hypothetical protein KDD76_06450 [Rickettsiales bacterium]|nr:hypothetical protein [Rickettsiales bacterium]